MKTYLYVLSPRGELDTYEIDLADMVTLIDWSNPNANQVYVRINTEGELIVPSPIVTEKVLHKKSDMEKSFYEEFSYLQSKGKGYFVDLLNWNQRPPRKPKKQKGEIVRLIYISSDFEIQRRSWTYIEDKEHSSRLVSEIYGQGGREERAIRFAVHSFIDENDFLDEIEKYLSKDNVFIIYSDIDVEELKELFLKRPNLYKELI